MFSKPVEPASVRRFLRFKLVVSTPYFVCRPSENCHRIGVQKTLTKLVKLTKFRILQAFLWFLNLVKLTKLIKLTKFTLGSRVWRRAFETHGLFSGAQSSKSSHLLPGTNKKHLAPLRHLNGHQDRRRACFHARQPSHATMRQSTPNLILTT